MMQKVCDLEQTETDPAKHSTEQEVEGSFPALMSTEMGPISAYFSSTVIWKIFWEHQLFCANVKISRLGK